LFKCDWSRAVNDTNMIDNRRYMGSVQLTAGGGTASSGIEERRWAVLAVSVLINRFSALLFARFSATAAAAARRSSVMIESLGCYGNDSFNNTGDYHAESIAPSTHVNATALHRGLTWNVTLVRRRFTIFYHPQSGVVMFSVASACILWFKALFKVTVSRPVIQSGIK